MLREKWQKAMRRSKVIIACKQFVCEKHFKTDDIERQKLLYHSNGKVIGISPYKRVKLKCSAVPSQFPWTEIIEVSAINFVIEE